MKIAVLGSINMDLVTQVEWFPHPGETIIAKAFAKFPGGKGANQAVAAARLGGKVGIFGYVGDDSFGEELHSSLRENGVNTRYLRTIEGMSSGIATILVNSSGENMISILPGANGRLNEEFVDEVLDVLIKAEILLLQLEIPLPTINHLLRKLPPLPDGPLVILDPAPVQDLSKLLVERIDILTPNRGELTHLAGIGTSSGRVERAMEILLSVGIGNIICKAGDRGAFWMDRDGRSVHFPAYSVEVVDSTAAGDAFNGGLAVALTEERGMEEAIPFANATGALSTTKPGAQPSMPSREEVAQLLARNRH